jgi:hypothetical protein
MHLIPGGIVMKKQQWLMLINVIIALLILWQVGTALLVDKLGDDLFPDLHRWTGYSLAVLVLVHTWLNWDWIMLRYFKRRAVSSASAGSK